MSNFPREHPTNVPMRTPLFLLGNIMSCSNVFEMEHIKVPDFIKLALYRKILSLISNFSLIKSRRYG